MNERRIWDALMEKIGNPYGVAGLMGNLYAESGLNPHNLQNTFEKNLGMTDEAYTLAVDTGTYDGFAHDKAGYGLAQWTHWSRKLKLKDFAQKRGASIGDLDMQLAFLLEELESYPAVLHVLKSAASVKEASDAVLTGYERPANQGASAKAKRAAYGQKYYDEFAGASHEEDGGKEGGTMGYDPQKVIDVALAEVGYLEKATCSQLDDKTANAGNKNYTKYARDLDVLAFYNGRKQGAPWCDVFADWCFVQAYGLEAALALTYQPLGKRNCGAGCKYSRRYYAQKGRLFDTAQPGDQVFFSSADGTSIQHTGYVVDVDDKYVYTVEGNVSGAVRRKKYDRNYVRFAGFGRPDYGMAISSETVQQEPPTPVPDTEANATPDHFSDITKMVRIKASAANRKVNLRQGDGTSYARVGQVADGTKLEYVATSPKGWHAVRYGKVIAWVSGNYAEVISDDD